LGGEPFWPRRPAHIDVIESLEATRPAEIGAPERLSRMRLRLSTLAVVASLLVACGSSAASPSGIATTSPTSTTTPASSTAASQAPTSSGGDSFAVETNLPPETAAPTQEPSPEPTPGEAAVTVEKTTLIKWADSIDYTHAQVIVELKNTGTGWADLQSSNDYTIYAKDGTVTTTGSFTYSYPRYVGPGMTGYLLEEAIESGKKVAEFATVDVSVESKTVDGPGPVLKVAKIKLGPESYGDGVTATGTITNTSSTKVGSTVIGVVLFDGNGRPLGYVYTNLIDNVNAGQTKGFETTASPPMSVSAVKKVLGFASSMDYY